MCYRTFSIPLEESSDLVHNMHYPPTLDLLATTCNEIGPFPHLCAHTYDSNPRIPYQCQRHQNMVGRTRNSNSKHQLTPSIAKGMDSARSNGLQRGSRHMPVGRKLPPIRSATSLRGADFLGGSSGPSSDSKLSYVHKGSSKTTNRDREQQRTGERTGFDITNPQ